MAVLDPMEDGEVPPMAEETVCLPLGGSVWVVRRPGNRWAMTRAETTARELAFGDDRADVYGPQPRRRHAN